MRAGLLASILLCASAPFSVAVSAPLQIQAGSAEDKAFQQIQSEANPDAKAQKLLAFEKQFPQSKALGSVYLLLVEFYRQKEDRAQVNDYAEKVLSIDDKNVTAMMVLSRNYAIERKNLDRAVELAQKAVELIGNLRAGPIPSTQTDAQWKAYVDNTEASARSILSYTISVRGH